MMFVTSWGVRRFQSDVEISHPRGRIKKPPPPGKRCRHARKLAERVTQTGRSWPFRTEMCPSLGVHGKHQAIIQAETHHYVSEAHGRV